jgi:methyl-accepting chemotaxis protein
MNLGRSLYRPLVVSNLLVFLQLMPWWFTKIDFGFETLFVLTIGVQIFAVSAYFLTIRVAPTLRNLRTQAVSSSRENVLKALVEVRLLPVFTAFISAAFWLMESVALLATNWAFDSAHRTSSIALVFPSVFLSFLYAGIFASARFGAEAQKLCENTDASAVFGLKAPMTWKIRNRIIVMCAALVLVSLSLLIDLSRIDHRSATVLICELLASCFAGAIVAREAASILTQPLRLLAGRARAGLFGPQAHTAIVAHGELWSLARAYADAELTLGVSAEKAHASDRSVRHLCDRVSLAVEKSTTSMTAQSSALIETTATTEELARTADGISESAAAVASLAKSTQSAAEAGQEALNSFQKVVLRMRQDNELIQSAVGRLSDRVTQIGKVVEFINGVAERCDLLAMSAELEGTYAGESGRGFALVGQELRRLSESVLESTAEVEELISEIHDAAKQTSGSTQRGETASAASVQLVFQCSRTLDRIVEIAKATVDELDGVATDTTAQKKETHELAESLSLVLADTQYRMSAISNASRTKDLLDHTSQALSTALLLYKREASA